MKKRYKILLAILILLGVSLVALYQYRVAIVSYIVPVITNDTINIVIENDTAYVKTKLIAKNKSFIPLQIDSIKYKIGLMNKVYLHEEKYLGIHLESYAADTFEFSLKIPIGELMRDLKAVREKTKQANYSILVALQYSTIFGRVDLPINVGAKFRIPTPPEINVEKVDYTKVKLDYMLADVRVKVTNFNEIKMTIETIHYILDVPGQGTAVGKYTEAITISPQSEMYVDLPVRIELDHFLSNLRDVAEDNDVYNYILTCNAIIKPFKEGQKPMIIELTKLGTLELKKPKFHPKISKFEKTLRKFFSGKKKN
jgi:LEA14-like dessication related protein